MPPSILVLGPTAWQRSEDPLRVVRLDPIDVRRALCSYMRRLGVEASILEDHEKIDSEDDFDFFLRIVRDRAVRTFVVYWPFGAKLHGLNVEIGFLLAQLKDGRLQPDQVVLLAEERALGIDAISGTFFFSEKGNRTRYHESLLRSGCTLRRWRHIVTLRRLGRTIAVEHRERHGIEPPKE